MQPNKSLLQTVERIGQKETTKITLHMKTRITRPIKSDRNHRTRANIRTRTREQKRTTPKRDSLSN